MKALGSKLFALLLCSATLCCKGSPPAKKHGIRCQDQSGWTRKPWVYIPSDAEVEVLDGPVFKLDDRMYLPSKDERCEVW